MARTVMDADLAALIGPRTGAILEESRTERGFMSDYTGVVTGERGRVFVKAVRSPGRLDSSLDREAAVAPFVREVSPALLWQERGRGWAALGFEYLPGMRHASFKPGSPDLAAVVAAVDRIGGIPLPEVVRDWEETRYDRYVTEGGAGLLRGPGLLHTDINPDNMLVDGSGKVTVVDWAWPARGAAWLDAACLVVQLIAAGHDPAGAEGHAAGCASFRDAGPAALDAFARANVAMFERFEEMDPAPWRKSMTAAAAAWAGHRGCLT